MFSNMEKVGDLQVDGISADSAVSRFNDAIQVYWTHPHCVNKDLRGAETVQANHIPNIVDKHRQLVGCTPTYITKLVEKRGSKTLLVSLSSVSIEDGCAADFVPHPTEKTSGINVRYRISLDISMNRITVAAYILNTGTDKDRAFLKNLLLPKIVHLMKSDLNVSGMVRSVRLVDLQEYNNCYQTIKAKYSKELIETWTETTNPEKFVHEDLAIAAYLLTYWKKVNKEPSFCDVGCGNGLLVYILIKEGFKGYGIDLRARNCWQTMFKETTEKFMKVAVLDPSDVHFWDNIPEVDWYIGNHSDELTPWIAFIAARLKKNAFLLPCCAWDFFGKYHKYGNRSTYQSYLEYVRCICMACGLQTQQDRLQIPSTKRICFVAEYTNNPEASDFALEQISKMANINYKFQVLEMVNSVHSTQPLIVDQVFKPRSTVIPVRNCTQIPKNTQISILTKIVGKILEYICLIDIRDIKQWNKGGSVSLSEISKLLTSEEKEALKQQGNGIQTLVKNYGHIFRIVNGTEPTVCLRTEPPITRNVNKEVSTKYCVYEQIHPQGCPLIGQFCNYIHAK